MSTNRVFHRPTWFFTGVIALIATSLPISVLAQAGPETPATTVSTHNNEAPNSPYLIQQPLPADAPAIVQPDQTATQQLPHDQAHNVIEHHATDGQTQGQLIEGQILESHVIVDGCDCGQPTCAGRCRIRRQRCFRCPSCETEGICHLKTKEVKEEKKCFVVKSKKICIPAIRLPWQKCESKCGRTKTIKTLSTKKYECPKCEYTWEIVEPEKAESVDTAQPGSIPTATPEPATDQLLEPVPAVEGNKGAYYRMPLRRQPFASRGIQKSLPPIVRPTSTSQQPPARKASTELRPNLFSNRNR